MLPGRRRLVWGVAIGVAALVVGRWTAIFATERLWEARVSEAAALTGTRFALLGAALELAGLAVAIAWFVGHFVWVARSVILQHGDLPRPLGRLTERSVILAAVALGLILGVAVGGGTSGWLPTILLHTADVRFGIKDPLLGADLGVFAGDLPLWELLYGRALALLLPALIGVVIVSALGGTLRIVDRRPWIARAARWHLGLLLVVAALAVGWRYALEPFRLAAARAGAIGPSEFLLRTTVAELEVLFAATAAVLTFLWTVRVRFVVALAGWVGLGLAVLAGGILVQSRTTGTPLAAPELATLRPVDSVGFGAAFDTVRTGPPADSIPPSLWDRDALVRIAGSDSVPVADAWSGTVEIAGRPTRVWILIRAAPRGEPAVIAVADDHTGPTGGIASLRWGDATFSPGIVPYLTLSRHHARPGAPRFDLDPAAAGVALSSTARRVAVAWALQTGAVLRATPAHRLAWHLDPVERLATLAPFASWSRPRVVVIDRDLYWVSDGFLALEGFPASRRIPWRGGEVGYLRAGLVGVVRARGGEARIYLRPEADSLAAAWQRAAAPLVEPAAAIPPAIRDRHGRSGLEAAIVGQVLQGSGWLARAVPRSGQEAYPVEDLSSTGSIADPHRLPFLSDDGERVAALLRWPGSDGETGSLELAAAGQAVGSPRDLQSRWDRFPFFQQLRDSIRAAGSEFVPGVIRFGVRGDTLFAYQPSYALGARTGGLVLVNVAFGPRLGAGRTFEEAWQNLRGETAPLPVGTDVGVRLEQARQWLDRADAALRRGDLQEFGRAFAYLRELLRPGPGPGPEPRP